MLPRISYVALRMYILRTVHYESKILRVNNNIVQGAKIITVFGIEESIVFLPRTKGSCGPQMEFSSLFPHLGRSWKETEDTDAVSPALYRLLDFLKHISYHIKLCPSRNVINFIYLSKDITEGL